MLPLTDKQVIQQSTKLMLISFNHRETHGTDVGGGRHHASVQRMRFIYQSWMKICCLHCLSTKVVQLLKDLAHEESTGNEMVCNSKWLVVIVVVVYQQQGNQNVCKHWEICQNSWGTTVEIVRDFCIDTREIWVLKLQRFCVRTRERW
jgi:hypothetical protein